MVAEATLRAEIPEPSLADLLELTALIALKDPHRHARVSVRWLQRWLEADTDATIYDVAFAASALQASTAGITRKRWRLLGTWSKVGLDGAAVVSELERSIGSGRWLINHEDGSEGELPKLLRTPAE